MRALTLILLTCVLFSTRSLGQFREATIPGDPYTDLIFDKHMMVYDKLLCHVLYKELKRETTVIVQNKAYLPFGVNGVTYDLGNSTYLIQLVHQEDEAERWCVWTEQKIIRQRM